MKPKYFSLFIVAVLTAVAAWSFSAVAQNQASAPDDAVPDSSVTLEDNPFSGDEAPPSAIQHRSSGPTQGPTENFTVKTWRISGTKKAAPIQLVSPAHNSKFTPGVVRFSWKSNGKSKRNIFDFVLEKLDVNKKAVQPTTLEKLSIDLKPGNYRWQVVNEKNRLASHWRSFRVIEMKSQSLTQLYQGRSPGEPPSVTRAAPRAAIAHHAAESAVKQRVAAKTSRAHGKEARAARGRPVESASRSEAVKTAKHSSAYQAGQPKPSSVAPANQESPPANQSFQDTDEQDLAQDSGIPGEVNKPAAHAAPQKATARTAQNPPKREPVRQARKAQQPKPHKTPVEARVPAEATHAAPPRRQKVVPSASAQTTSAAPAAPAVKPDERQRELDTLKFDE